MSLTLAQENATRSEFAQNIQRSGLSLTTIAEALGTTERIIRSTVALNTNRLEDPWIVKNYLLKVMQERQVEPVTFSALKGDYHQYWFLDAARIERGVID